MLTRTLLRCLSRLMALGMVVATPLILPTLSSAQSNLPTLQTAPVYVDDKLLKDSKGNNLIDPDEGTISLANVGTLLSNLLKPVAKHPYIIHSAVWAKPNALADKADHWYVYDPSAPIRGKVQEVILNDGWTDAKFTGTRLWGTKTFTLIYIYQKAMGISTNDPSLPAHKAGDQIQVNTASGLATLACDSTTCVDTNYMHLVYTGTVTKTTPQPITDLEGAVKIAIGQAAVPAGVVTLQPISLSQHQDYSVPEPSSIQFTVNSGQTGGGLTATKISSQTFSNEGNYHWDVSFLVPLNTYKDLTYNSTANGIEPSSVTRQNIYAAFDWYPWPKQDLSKPQLRLVPYLIAGLPIKKAPLDNTMIGTGMGFNYIAPFAGLSFVISHRPAPGVTYAPSAELPKHLSVKFIWGVNLSVSTISKMLTSSKGSTAASAPSK